MVKGRCEQHKAKTPYALDFDKRRGTATQRGYDSRWRKYRVQFLRLRPLCECEECKRLKRVLPAVVVDHIIPHRGDQDLFWDPNNHQSLAKACHDRKTAGEVNARKRSASEISLNQ